jgi:large subunit ribosomal protein L13
MKTTYFAKPGEVEKKWVIIDATDKVLGRIASKAASIIRGKTKPTFTPHTDTGDNVIIINAAKVKLTGKKWDDKIYYHHTGWSGGIKSSPLKKFWKKSLRICCKKPFVGCYLKIDWAAP